MSDVSLCHMMYQTASKNVKRDTLVFVRPFDGFKSFLVSIWFLLFWYFLCLYFQMSSALLFFSRGLFSGFPHSQLWCLMLFDWFMLPLVAICFESIISFLLVMNLFFWVSTAILRPFPLHWSYCRFFLSLSLSWRPVLKVLARRGAANATQLTGWFTH